MSIQVKRTATILKPNQSRVLLRPFSPGNPERVARIIARIMSLPEDRVGLRIPAKEIGYSELMPIIFRRSEAKQFHVASLIDISQENWCPGGERLGVAGRVCNIISSPGVAYELRSSVLANVVQTVRIE